MHVPIVFLSGVLTGNSPWEATVIAALLRAAGTAMWRMDPVGALTRYTIALASVGEVIAVGDAALLPEIMGLLAG